MASTFLTGYSIKPLSIGYDGVVLFSDGTKPSIEVTPNQQQCEAYGYTYNIATGTCSAFSFNVNLNKEIANINNVNNGSGNTNDYSSNTIQVNGISNSTLGYNRNCFINGSQNQIASGVQDASVFGKLAEATSNNSVVLGGNAIGDNVGERQNITLMFGTETTDNTVSDSYLNNTSGSYFAIPDNTVVCFQTETVGVRIGGTGGGSLGDFKASIEVGVAINKSGVLSIDKSRTTIANVGTTSGWVTDIKVSGKNLVQTVKGSNNRTVMWATTIRITQIKTGVAL